MKTRKKREKTGKKWARYGLKRVNTGRDRRDQLEGRAGLAGVMGIQSREVEDPASPDVTLIRHAYTRSELQGRGVGTALLRALRRQTTRPVLIGTWAAGDWAVKFYEKHGFSVIRDVEEKNRLLRTYWCDLPSSLEPCDLRTLLLTGLRRGSVRVMQLLLLSLESDAYGRGAVCRHAERPGVGAPAEADGGVGGAGRRAMAAGAAAERAAGRRGVNTNCFCSHKPNITHSVPASSLSVSKAACNLILSTWVSAAPISSMFSSVRYCRSLGSTVLPCTTRV